MKKLLVLTLVLFLQGCSLPNPFTSSRVDRHVITADKTATTEQPSVEQSPTEQSPTEKA